VLILDEPTAVLTPQEVKRLFETVRRLKDAGKAIIFITHKMNEVQEIADRITVLRDGRVARTTTPDKTNSKELAMLMVGRDVLFRLEKGEPCTGNVVLEVENIKALNDRGLPALQGISFCIARGEVMGVAGVAGNGQRELAEVLTGLRRVTSGSIKVDGNDITNASSRKVIERKVGHIPEDRLGEGLAPGLPVADNEILKGYRSESLSRGPFLVQKKILELAQQLIGAFNIDTPGPQTAVRMLSGGNQQKVLLARELHLAPNLLVAVHPTRGLDIGATEFVRKRILQQRDEGTAVLLISEDLEEVLAVSDRVAVIYEGQIMGILPADQADISEIGMMMAGARENRPVDGIEGAAA
jgi:simple sugar transport system ATP-binding protein